VLVPVKVLARSKQRLKPCLGKKRQGLTLAMLQDVLQALLASREVERVAVVTADAAVRKLALESGALVVSEAGASGMCEAIGKGLEAVRQSGGRQVAIVHADIPLLTGAEVDRLLREYHRQRRAADAGLVAAAPAHDRNGTNLLVFDSGRPFPLKYGPDSFRLHREAAQAAGRRFITLESAALALDIDDEQDLEHFVAVCQSDPVCRATASWRYLAGNRIRQTSLTQDQPMQVKQHSASPDHYERFDLPQLQQLNDRLGLDGLCTLARGLRDRGHGNIVTYSRKVFIPLTRLCRDVCHYCTFATVPRHLPAAYMSADEAVEIARQGAAMGCKEALFTLGERPELRHAAAREALAEMGFATTLEYVAHVAERVLAETGLLPHINAGCMTPGEVAMLRPVSASMGIMLESASARLCEKGQVHYGSPDKQPAVRLETIREAGRQNVPFTTGILIGIGETRQERLESLLAIRDLHREYGHIQEVIVQNFVPKADTKMAAVEPPGVDELRWSIAMARIVFGPDMSIQAPPNLSPGQLAPLLDAGINDWGGVSPLTPDHVNPESPWPQLAALAQETAVGGKLLQERLTIYPAYNARVERWVDKGMVAPVLKLCDGYGLAREDDWLTGQSTEPPASFPAPGGRAKRAAAHPPASMRIRAILDDALDGRRDLSVDEISQLFNARGSDLVAVCGAADRLRASVCGDTVTYVVNRNINYTNICSFRCKFCAFAKGRKNTPASDAPYLKSPLEVGQLAAEAWERGATEVCLQGGIHPAFTGQTYIDICAAVRTMVPDMHIHAFSPLEVTHGAQSFGMPVRDFLAELKKVGLKTLPGTAAEILSDDVRAVICPDKINTRQWMDVISSAHELGLGTTATIMFGHVEGYRHWAIHLKRILELQKRSGGFTEFVPLPFVADGAPIYRRGQARRGPTFREAVLMHAVARLVLSPEIRNIQTSWVKMGLKGAALCLGAGANDLGGTLMNESITRAAGAKHGQEMTSATLEGVIRACGREPLQRNTLYAAAEPAPFASAPGELNVIGSAYTDFYGSPVRGQR